MSEWGKLLSMIPKKAAQAGEALEGPLAEVIGDGTKSLKTMMQEKRDAEWAATMIARAKDKDPGSLNIQEFMMANDMPDRVPTDSDKADYVKYMSELASEGFVPKDSWVAKYGQRSARGDGIYDAKENIIGKLANSTHRKQRSGLDTMKDLADELRAKVEGGGTLSPEEEQTFGILKDNMPDLAKRLNVRDPWQYRRAVSEIDKGAEVKPFPFTLDTMKKNIVDKQPDLITPKPRDIEKTQKAWQDAEWDSPQEADLYNKLQEMKNPTLKRIKGVALAPLGAASFQSPTDMIGDAMGAYESLKDKLAHKVVDATNFMPAYAQLPQEDKDRQAALLGMGADPTNMLPGASGLGAAFLQMLAKKPQE